MKVTLEERPGTETEVLIRCANADAPQVRALLELLETAEQRIPVRRDGAVLFWPPREVLYCEAVDRSIFAYTAAEVLPTPLSLGQLEQEFSGFFRCSRTMLVNLHAINSLRSYVGGRIAATLCNGETILISRHYAAGLRMALSLGKEHSK